MPGQLKEQNKQKGQNGQGLCLACGKPLEKLRQRYCRPGCKEEFVFKLRWFNNILRLLNTRYATFAFSQELLVLNVLPQGSAQDVHSYFYSRSPGKRPAQDINRMVFDLGSVWWGEKNQARSNSQAGREVLRQGSTRMFPVYSVQPWQQCFAARISRQLTVLRLKSWELQDGQKAEEKIKAAFRRAALEHHPDQGGSNIRFRQIYQAYQDLLAWMQRPVFQHRQGVPDQWCFIAARNRWVTPL
ncbi:MAG: DnaJ domain-containing protein [Desulfohalobiaceae bacterium]